MIRSLLRRVFSRGSAKPKVIALSSHGVTRERISPCARRVIEALQGHSYKAFVVGGAVRDLLLGKQPNDFDVATDAHPEQVKGAFRRSRIIGRRFRLVHCMCGNETVEVATYRRAHDAEAEGEGRTDEHGRLLRDNVYGTQPEDAARRDFTINALFYDPASQEIVDYHNGVADLKKKQLRMIGDPGVRYREDPVRMLRAVRFAASYGLEIEKKTLAPIRPLASLLQNVPPARLFDEMLKLLLSGHATQCVARLRREGLHHGLLPLLDVILEQPLGERFVMLALNNTDVRILEGKPVSPGFLFAALLWHEVLATSKKVRDGGMAPMPALFLAMDQVLETQTAKLAIPRRYTTDMKELWALQQRLENRAGRRPFRVLEHPRFRAAYDFLQLRCDSGELDAEIGDWWRRFQQAGAHEREGMLLREPEAKRRRRRRRPALTGAVQPDVSV
ncbi:MAG: polynucleotide adenylyltransferase PcnB [Betaproteobacteria bacterium]|nr:MAG: polynucleotide adenylyltransferase PcnB [Betaproteobacteria bacterium]